VCGLKLSFTLTLKHGASIQEARGARGSGTAMARIIRPEDFVPKHPAFAQGRTSQASRELAEYIAETLRSLTRASGSPELRALQALLEAAEREARTISCDRPGIRNIAPTMPKGDMRPWRRGLS